MSQEPSHTDPEQTEVVPPVHEAAAPTPGVPPAEAPSPGAPSAAPPPPPPTGAAAYPPPPPGWEQGWGRRAAYRPRRRGVELLVVGLAGLILGCMLGAGITAIAVHFTGHRGDGSGDRRGYGLYDRGGVRGPMGPNMRGPGFPGMIPSTVPTTPVPSSS